MWTKKVDRKELPEILTLGGLASRSGARELHEGIEVLAGPDDIELLWGENPLENKRLLVAIIVEGRIQKDLLAWVNTYVPSIRPLTAYSRILDRQTAAHLSTLNPYPRLGRLEDACLGLIIGETATYVSNKGAPRGITHAACLSTLSFSIARAAGFGFDRKLISDVEDHWSRTRAAIGAPTLPISVDPVESAWSVIRHLSEAKIDLPPSRPVGEAVLEACSQILSSGAIATNTWMSLTKDVPQLGPLRGELTGPREDRLVLFERAASELPRTRGRGDTNSEFLCAYLASSISPGTLDHMHILLPYVDALPGLLIWYGLCAGLSSRGSFESGLDGLVRRTKRDVVKEDTIFQAPSCDIAFGELEVIGASTRDLTDLRTLSTGLLIVELAPFINTVFRLRKTDSATEAPAALVTSVVDDLTHTLERASELVERLRRESGLRHPSGPERGRKRRHGG